MWQWMWNLWFVCWSMYSNNVTFMCTHIETYVHACLSCLYYLLYVSQFIYTSIYMLWYVPEDAMPPFTKRGPECLLWHLHSEWLVPLSWPGACADIPTKTDHNVFRVSCENDWHHMMTFWWCGGFWMMTFTSVSKGYKRKNAWEGGGSKF